jgi:putative transcriptional regulator
LGQAPPERGPFAGYRALARRCGNAAPSPAITVARAAAFIQTAFAARFGFSTAAVGDWEQGRRQPEASARVLLTVMERDPEAVMRALAAGEGPISSPRCSPDGLDGIAKRARRRFRRLGVTAAEIKTRALTIGSRPAY